MRIRDWRGLTQAADRRHAGLPPPVLLSTDSGNDDLARGEGILKLAMGEGEDAEEKNSDRLLRLTVADSVMDPEVEMLC